MSTSRIALSTSAYVRINFGLGPLLVEANEGEIRVVVTENQPAVSNNAYHRVTDRNRLELVAPDTNTWALANTSVQKAVVTENQNVIEVSDRGGVGQAVYIQDQTTDMLDLIFLEEKFTGLTLASVGVLDARTFTLTAAHGLTNANSDGHSIELANTATGRFVQAEILDVTGDVVTIDQPLSEPFPTATTVITTGNPNMAQDAATGVAIDGSVTPVIFSVKPIASQSGDITRILLATKSSNTSDLTTFGGGAALAVGLTLRKRRSDGTFKNLYVYKDNFDIALHGFDTNQYDPRGGNATYGFGGRVTFAGQSKHGVAERLDGALGEQLQIVVYELMDDTTTGNTSVQFIAEGSELQAD